MGLREKFLEIGIAENVRPEEVEWMKMSDESEHFLSWFSKYIDTCNKLSPSEINAQIHLCETSTTNERDIDHALAEHGFIINSSLDVTESNLYCLDEDIEMLSQHANLLQDHDQLLCKEVAESNSKEQEEGNEQKKFQMNLFKESQNLMKLSAQNKAIFDALGRSIFTVLSILMEENSDEDSKKVLLSQIDLNEFSHLCNKFDGQLHLYMKRLFRKSLTIPSNEFSTSNGNSEISKTSHSLHDESEDIPEKMEGAIIAIIASQAELHGSIAAGSHIKRFLKDLSSMHINNLRLRMDTDMMQEEIQCLSEEIHQSVVETVSKLAEEEVLCKIASVSLKVARQRIDRRVEMLQKLSTLRQYLDKRVLLGELVWMLLHREAKVVSYASKLLSESYKYFEEELSEHLSIMNELQNIEWQENRFKIPPVENQVPLLEVLNLVLKNEEGGHVSLGDLLSTVESHTRELEYQIIGKLSSHISHYNEGQQSLSKLVQMLSGGFTKQPALYPSDLLCQLEEAQATLTRVSKERDSLQNAFTTKKLALESSFIRNRRLLWAWFLVAPDRLEDAFRQAAYGITNNHP